MKTTVIQPRKKPAIEKPLSFPAIFKSSDGGIVLAISETRGVVLFDAGGRFSDSVGYTYDDPARWDESASWTRSSEPVTIKFQP